MNDDDARFVEQVRQTLERSSDALDDITVARLGAARRRALDAHRSRAHWFKLTGIAGAAAAAALTVMLWVNGKPTAPKIPLTAADYDMATAGHPLELYDNLDFYLWLEARGDNEG